MNQPISYKDAGVDIQKGEQLVSRIKEMVQSTYGERVYHGVGGFASLYRVGNGKLLAAGTDGVGTKLKVAKMLGIHNTIGIDLVAMCVNDILCTGASPLFFMDYLATGKLDLVVSEAVIEGIVEGCKQSKMALIGGETAEMPGMYQEGDYDLAGFAVGEVAELDLIDGQKVEAGDSIIGLASAGVHSNGFSLVRKLIAAEEKELLRESLTPTRIYCSLIQKICEKHSTAIKGMAHITGGGLTNICRIHKGFDYHIEHLPSLEEIPQIFTLLKERANLPLFELYETFNMGVGFVIISKETETLTNTLDEMGEKYWILGKTTSGTGNLLLQETH